MKYIKFGLIVLAIFIGAYSINVLAGGNAILFLETVSCEWGFGPKTNAIIMTFITVLAWGAPTLMMVYTIADILKAVTSGDVKDTNAIFKKLGLRLIISALIFFTPALLKLIFEGLGLTFCDL